MSLRAKVTNRWVNKIYSKVPQKLMANQLKNNFFFLREALVKGEIGLWTGEIWLFPFITLPLCSSLFLFNYLRIQVQI